MDPLSPYIFYYFAEILSGLLEKGQQEGQINGISIATNAPTITHLLYVDNNIFLLEEIENKCQKIDVLLYQKIHFIIYLFNKKKKIYIVVSIQTKLFLEEKCLFLE